MTLLSEMIEHARQELPNESCGLVVASGKRHRLIRAKNIAAQPRVNFDLDPEAWLEVGESESVIAIYHSHPHTDAEPSMSDRVSCESTQLPWHIVNPVTEQHCLLTPVGYVAPYVGRPYLYGPLDCYSIIRDWYLNERCITLMDFKREVKFWEKGKNTFVDNIEACGFVQLQGQPPETGDLFIIQHGASVPNHIVLYVGDGKILHHVEGRLSKVDPFGGVWQRHSTHHLRHMSRVGVKHG